MVREILTQGRVALEIEVVELLRKDSLEMTDADRAQIREAISSSPASHFVVTHGTDTIVDTARVLQQLSGKTVVLTGALQPGRFADSDAPFNLGMAIAAVQTLAPGIYIAANGRVFAADKVRKNRELNRFEDL
jgi:L-asparaginase